MKKLAVVFSFGMAFVIGFYIGDYNGWRAGVHADRELVAILAKREADYADYVKSKLRLN